MQNVFHKKLVKRAMRVSTFVAFKLKGANITTADIVMSFRFGENEIVKIRCDYHGEFISLRTSTGKILNSHLLRFVEIKKELGLR